MRWAAICAWWCFVRKHVVNLPSFTDVAIDLGCTKMTLCRKKAYTARILGVHVQHDGGGTVVMIRSRAHGNNHQCMMQRSPTHGTVVASDQFMSV